MKSANTTDPLSAELTSIINRQRTDIQLGAPSDSPHATSVLEKPGIADLLSLAIDRGSITKTANGTGLTLSTTPYAISTALGQRDTPARWQKAYLARSLSVSATFSSTDVTQGDFSSFTSGEIKYVIFGNRSPRDKALLDAVRGPLAQIFLASDSAIDQACGQVPVSGARNKVNAWLQAPDNLNKTVEQARAELDAQVSTITVDPAKLKSCVVAILTGEQSIAGGLDKVTAATKDYLTKNPLQLSFAALFVRDSMLSDYYTAKLLYGYDVAPLTINLNAEASWNKSSVSPSGAPLKSLRDYSIVLGVNSNTLLNGRLDYSLSAKASRDETMDAKSIVLGEAKLNLHLTDVLRLPLAASYANRETVTVKQGWQFNVGLSAFLDDVLRSLR